MRYLSRFGIRQRAFTAGCRSYPYGLLVPVACVGTTTAADEVRRFLDTCGIRSTVAPCTRRSYGPVRALRKFQVLVFADDAGPARRLVNAWTLPVGDQQPRAER
ncbi:hypothetical protein AB0K89_11420 [Streptomyces cinnamoneus]|uniref:hypothetical protein n=1 Tax=Streptomyces cinnamoneus TaxID=53446 RepID=UPI0034437ADC